MTKSLASRTMTCLAICLAFTTWACDNPTSDPTDPTGAFPDIAPSLSVAPFPGSAVVQNEQFTVCKVGGPEGGAVFNIDVKDTESGDPVDNFDVTIADGECLVVWFEGGSDETITVTETVPDGFADPTWVKDQCVTLPSGTAEPCQDDPNAITTTTGAGNQVSGVVGGVGANGTIEGALVTFTNHPGSEEGRMTGGGGQIRVDGVRITRGLTLHCDITLSNNLEINWTGGNKWHLDKPITSATCIDDPAIDPVPPAAPFDTFIGEGEGALNGEAGSIVRFVFADAGEPGTDDTAWIAIWAPGADPDTDAPVLEVSGLLDNGNLQAHYDQPHK